MRSTRAILPIATLITGSALLSPATSHAEPTKAEIAAARRLFAEAEREEAANRWADALQKLRSVVAIKETAGVRFHLAHCEERLGQLVAALTDYRRAAKLAEGTSGPESDDIQRRAGDELAALEPRIPTVALTLPDDVPGASVTLDGKTLVLASPPAPLRLDPGEYRFEATATGRVPFAQRLILVEQGRYQVTIALPLVPVAPPPAAPPQAPAPAEHAAAPPPREPAPRPEPSSGPSALTYVAGGATLLLGGATVAFYSKKSSLEKETADACATHCDATARQDSIDQQRTLMYAAGGATLLAAGLTVTLAVTSMSTPKSTTLIVTPSGAFLTGKF